jgi:hypothetical protein
MKTESFDDAIRNKLDRIDPPFREDAAGQINRYVTLNRKHASAGRKYAYIFILPVLGTAIAGLLTWNIRQLNENSQLLGQIGSLQQTIAHIQSLPAPVKKDTIYITRYTPVTIKEQAQSYLSGVTKKHIASRTGMTHPDDAPVDAGAAALSEQYAKQPGNADAITVSSQQSTGNSTFNHTSAASIVPGKQGGHQQPAVTEKTMHADQPESTKPEAGQSEHASIDSSGPVVKNAPAMHVNDSMTVAGNKDAGIDSIAGGNVLSSGKKQEDVSRALLRQMTWQAGVGFELANDQVGAGVTGEVLLTDRWGLSAGLKLLTISNEKYKDANEFKLKKGQDFRDTYTPATPDTTFISMINMQYTVLQVPVKITYYYPLRNRYSIVFSAGTDIDILSYQHIDYTLSTNFSAPVKGNYDAKNPTVLFNNTTFAAGIQKQWEHLVVQAVPFVSPQLRAVAYKKEDIYMGISLRVFYRFGQ